MSRQLISSGSSFEKTNGYSRAVVDGEWVFVSGTTGFDYAKMSISDDLAEQVHQTFRNIEAALKQAGVSLAHVVRANYIVLVTKTDPDKGHDGITLFIVDIRDSEGKEVEGFSVVRRYRDEMHCASQSALAPEPPASMGYWLSRLSKYEAILAWMSNPRPVALSPLRNSFLCSP